MHHGPYICAVYYIISNNFPPVVVHTSQRFTSILTDNIVIDSHRQVILKKWYLNVFGMVQGVVSVPGHWWWCVESTEMGTVCVHFLMIIQV